MMRKLVIITPPLALVILFIIYMTSNREINRVESSLAVFSIATNSKQLWSDQEDWEIPVTFQYYDEDGVLGYESDSGMELFGGESRKQPQKSLELLAKKKYGTKQFEHAFFQNSERSDFDSLILRNGGQDFPLTHMRDSLAAIIAEPIIMDVPAYQPVVVYINDQYWGIYDLREKMDKHFLASRYHYSTKSIDLLEADGEVKAGSDKKFLQLLEALDNNESSRERISQLESLIDVSSLFDYMIIEAYIGNTDWPDHNIRYWRSDEGDGRWRWLLYDADLSFGNADEPTLARLLSPELSLYPSVRIFQELLTDTQLREQFLRRFGVILNGSLSEDVVTEMVNSMSLNLEPEMIRHQKRWDGNIEDWHSEVDLLVAFAKSRGDELRVQLKNSFQLTDDDMSAYGLD